MDKITNTRVLPAVPSAEMIGRMVENAFGVKEAVHVPRSTWYFYDWCQENGLDMVGWVRKIDEARPSNVEFSYFLWGCLWKLECSRYKQGLPCPPGSPPEGYADFLEKLESGVFTEMNKPLTKDED
ncbi:MAG: hypothetical protein OIF51_08835 [Cellvibrionaceae bacterium]|nr:hypothetical protein [Cellvibrionaceae bacterium]